MAEQVLFPEYGVRPQPGKSDPRLSVYKSVLQKLIRRGEVGEAVSVAAEMLEVPGGRDSLAKRLPVIAAEDVGWWTLPYVIEPMMAGQPSPVALLDIVAGLAASPKARTASWLANELWYKRRVAREGSADALRASLEEGDYIEALAVCYRTAENARGESEGPPLHGKGGVAIVLHEWAEESPDVAKRIVKAGLWRSARGGEGGLVMSAYVIAAIDRPTEFPAPWEIPAYEVRRRQVPFPWWSIDGHVSLGRIALSMVSKRQGLKGGDWLGGLQFAYESSLVGPVLLDAENERWKAESEQIDADRGGWVDHAHGQQLWDLYRPDVKSATEWIQQKFLEKGDLA